MSESPESGGAQVIDLMEALRASLEKKGPARAKAPEPKAKAAAAERKPPKRAQAEPVARKAKSKG